MSGKLVFNPAPGWPKPPAAWVPPKGWAPDPSWPPAPPGWQLWISQGNVDGTVPSAMPQDSVSLPSVQSPVSAPASNIDQRLALLAAENAALRARLEETGVDTRQVIVLDDERVLQDVGIYRYHHPLENAVAFKERLDFVLSRVAALVKAGAAIERSNTFTFDGRLVEIDASRLQRGG